MIIANILVDKGLSSALVLLRDSDRFIQTLSCAYGSDLLRAKLMHRRAICTISKKGLQSADYGCLHCRKAVAPSPAHGGKTDA